MAKKILFDTDIGWDCDDAGALALIHSLCNLEEAELLAATATYADEYVAGCIDAINRFYGRSVPVGICYARRTHFSEQAEGYCGYAKSICEQFENDYRSGHSPQDSVKLMRRVLADAEGKSITFIATGPLSCLAQLVASEADEISDLSGRELIAEKIERTVVMGGRFRETWPMPIAESGVGELLAEYNIKGDLEASKAVCDCWPGELIFSSYEIGNYCITLKDLKYDENHPNPIALAYRLFCQNRGRESWDPTAALYAIRPDAGYYYLHPFGKISVSDDGVTTWEESTEFRHSYLIPRLNYADIEKTIDSVVTSQLEKKSGKSSRIDA